jgi:hypothetical protein
MAGTIPTVLTVMCRAPMPNPSGALRIVRVVLTAGQLSSGLAHPHEHDVGRLEAGILEDDLAHLSGDFPNRQVPAEAHSAGRAEHAAQGAAGLGRNAKGSTRAGRNKDRLDCLAVLEPPEILPRSVSGDLNGLLPEPGQGKLICQDLPEVQRELGSLIP